MKKFLIYSCVLLLVACTSTKETTSSTTVEVKPTLDRKTPPPPGPAPEIKIGEYQQFQLENGLNVYVVENDKLPRVALSLQVDRDPILEGEKVGYIGMVGNLLSRGTTSKTKAKIDESIDFIGASLSTSASGMYGASLSKHRDSLLTIMKDILLNPSFPEEELDKLKRLELSNLAGNKEDPAIIISNIRGVALYGKDHPYGEMIDEESIKNITREDVEAFYNKYWSPKKAHLAIVGDITVEEAKALANKYFGAWKGSAIPEHSYNDPIAPQTTKVVLVDRPQSVQSEIRVSYPVDLKLGDEDFFSTKLLNQILGGSFTSRLMQNLREDKGYTYGAGSGFLVDRVIGRFSAGASVRNEVTDSAVYEILYELDKIVESGVTEDELQAAKAYLTGSFARSLESPQTVAGFAINTALNDLSESFYAEYLKQLNNVSVADVNAAAKKYIKPKNAYIIVVGKASEIAEKLKKFGEVQYYDVEGNRYDPAEMNKALQGIQPQTIIEDYFKALGGKEKVLKLTAVKKEWSLNIQGQALKVEEVKMAGGKFRQDVKVGGMAVQQVISDGKDVIMLANGMEQPMDDETKMSEIMNNRLFPELYFNNIGAKLKLEGIEKVNGGEAYNVTVIYKNGSQSQIYFDVKTGLKVKTSSVINSPMGQLTKSTVLSDYKAVDGIQFPHTETTKVGPQEFSATLVSVDTNAKVVSDYFEIKR